jgi:two-component system response regulator FlrC
VTAPAALRELLPAAPREPEPLAESPVMRLLLEAADDVAPTRTTVLLLGESGTGKEVLARYLHRRSPRAEGPWVAVNCAALPGDLLESELFGHERGAFTGAAERRVGRIEQADGGTLLLDEVSELPLLLQAKLLRVLQEREIDRVGGQRPVPVDVRLIATSNRDLAGMVAAGEFRQDLFYRLNVFPLQLPPLRERREDLPLLARALLERLAQAHGRDAPALDQGALRALSLAPLPGNVRELGNLLERALVRCRGPLLTAAQLGALEALPTPAGPQPAPRQLAHVTAPALSDEWRANPDGFPSTLPLELAELERLAIAEALRRTGGNRTRAAQLLGIGLRTLRARLNGVRAAEEVPDTLARFPQNQQP